MIEIIKKYRFSLILYDLLFLSGLVLVIAVPRLELHLIMNSSHTSAQDSFFKAVTWLGDGWFAVILSAFFLLIRFRYFFMLIISYAVSGLLAQFFKRVFFPEAMRPAVFLEQMPGLNLVEGVGLNHTLSFPSGHTTTAFAVLVLLGLISRSKAGVLGGIILAWCVAISRVYLSQHFLADVIAGSLLGMLSALFFYWYFRRLKPEWLDQSLIMILSPRK